MQLRLWMLSISLASTIGAAQADTKNAIDTPIFTLNECADLAEEAKQEGIMEAMLMQPPPAPLTDPAEDIKECLDGVIRMALWDVDKQTLIMEIEKCRDG